MLRDKFWVQLLKTNRSMMYWKSGCYTLISELSLSKLHRIIINVIPVIISKEYHFVVVHPLCIHYAFSDSLIHLLHFINTHKLNNLLLNYNCSLNINLVSIINSKNRIWQEDWQRSVSTRNAQFCLGINPSAHKYCSSILMLVLSFLIKYSLCISPKSTFHCYYS